MSYDKAPVPNTFEILLARSQEALNCVSNILCINFVCSQAPFSRALIIHKKQ